MAPARWEGAGQIDGSSHATCAPHAACAGPALMPGCPAAGPPTVPTASRPTPHRWAAPAAAAAWGFAAAIASGPGSRRQLLPLHPGHKPHACACVRPPDAGWRPAGACGMRWCCRCSAAYPRGGCWCSCWTSSAGSSPAAGRAWVGARPLPHPCLRECGQACRAVHAGAAAAAPGWSRGLGVRSLLPRLDRGAGGALLASFLAPLTPRCCLALVVAARLHLPSLHQLLLHAGAAASVPASRPALAVRWGPPQLLPSSLGGRRGCLHCVGVAAAA